MLVYRHFTGEALSSFWRKQITGASGHLRIKPVLCVKGKNWEEEPNITIFLFILIFILINSNNKNMCTICKLAAVTG